MDTRIIESRIPWMSPEQMEQFASTPTYQRWAEARAQELAEWRGDFDAKTKGSQR